MNDAHPTPTDAVCNMALRSAVFEILRRHDVSDQCFAEVASVTHAALAQQQPSGEVAGWVYEVDEGDGFQWLIGRELPADTPHHFRNAFPLKYADTPAWNANMDEAPRDGWLPIETVPTEDEWANFMFAWPHNKTPSGWMYDFWSVKHLRRMQEAVASGQAKIAPHLYWVPTHWQHLPQPPKEQG
jgi:hypothetical protein